MTTTINVADLERSAPTGLSSATLGLPPVSANRSDPSIALVEDCHVGDLRLYIGTVHSTPFFVHDTQAFTALFHDAAFTFGEDVAVLVIDGKRNMMCISGSGPDVNGMPSARLDPLEDPEYDETDDWASLEDMFAFFAHAFRQYLLPGRIVFSFSCYDGIGLSETTIAVDGAKADGVSVVVNRQRTVNGADGELDVIKQRPISICRRAMASVEDPDNVIAFRSARR